MGACSQDCVGTRGRLRSWLTSPTYKDLYCEWVCMCHGVLVEVGQQLLGIDYFLPLWVLGLCAGAFAC